MKRLLLLLALLPALASAAEFNVVQADKSRIDFVFRQMGVPVDGRFKTFVAKIAFDPARPEAGSAQIDIDLAGLDAGSAEANDEAKGKAWFNTREFPQASFVATGVKALGGNRFEARGRMTIKGRTREVVAPFAYRMDGAVAVIDGVIPLMRLQYGIGEGVWSDTAAVADEVPIKFRFAVAAGRK